MKILFVYFNLDGFIRVIEQNILDAFDQLQIDYEVCFVEDYERKVKEYDPILTLFFHPSPAIYRIKETIRTSGGHKLLWDLESPYESDITFDMLDTIHYMFVSDEATVEELKKKQPTNQIYYVPHACNPKVHKPIDEVPYEYKSDYLLIGNAYKSRINWLRDNADMFKGKMLTVIGVGYWGIPGLENQRYLRMHVSQEECAKYYNGAKTVLNIHRTNADLDMANRRLIVPKHLNNRFYEVAAMGKEQLVINRDNMTEEIERVKLMKPDEYSYVARLQKYLIPLLG